MLTTIRAYACNLHYVQMILGEIQQAKPVLQLAHSTTMLIKEPHLKCVCRYARKAFTLMIIPNHV
jgi:hypothetical protein